MENQINDSNVTPKPKGTESLCGLAILFRIIGVASIILGLICAGNFTTDYSGYFSHTNYALVVAYITGGFLMGMFNFALAIIVDACQRYRKAH